MPWLASQRSDGLSGANAKRCSNTSPTSGRLRESLMLPGATRSV